MASLRLELEGKDREVHELTANTHALQEQLERVILHSPDNARQAIDVWITCRHKRLASPHNHPPRRSFKQCEKGWTTKP